MSRERRFSIEIVLLDRYEGTSVDCVEREVRGVIARNYDATIERLSVIDLTKLADLNARKDGGK